MALTHVLLFFHLVGAVSFFAGAAVAGTLQLAAIRRERPSEVWVASMAVGGCGGRTARHARHLAQRLAAEGDASSPELRALLAARRPCASYASGLMLLATLVLMVWR